MAENTNYFKLRTGKYWEVVFFSPKTFGQQYRRALTRLAEMKRQGGEPVLSVNTHPRVKGQHVLPVVGPKGVVCIGGCHECSPEVPGVDPDEPAGN